VPIQDRPHLVVRTNTHRTISVNQIHRSSKRSRRTAAPNP